MCYNICNCEFDTTLYSEYCQWFVIVWCYSPSIHDPATTKIDHHVTLVNPYFRWPKFPIHIKASTAVNRKLENGSHFTPNIKQKYIESFLVGSVLHMFLLFVLSYCVSLGFEFYVVTSITFSASKWCSVRLYLQLFISQDLDF